MSTVQVNGPQRSSSIDIRWRSILDGVRYAFRLKYRERYDCWDIQIATAQGEVVIDGIRVAEGNDMLAAWTDPRLPPGQLVCVDTRGLGEHPTRDDWRDRHILTYTSPSGVVEDNELSSVLEVLPPG